MDLVEKFGLDPRLLLWQVINFAILLFIIHRFLYKPLLAMLEKRTATIEKSLDEARKIEEMSKKSRDEYQDIVTNAKKEAMTIIDAARETAEKQRELAVEKTKQDIAQVVAQAKVQLQQERATVLKEAKDKFAELVIRTTQAVLGDVSDREIDHELVKKAVEKL